MSDRIKNKDRINNAKEPNRPERNADKGHISVKSTSGRVRTTEQALRNTAKGKTVRAPTIIMIMGSSHSGTTVLKSIIGRARGCHEIVGELKSGTVKSYVDVAMSSTPPGCEFVVVKRPPGGLSSRLEHCQPIWENIVRILITRNPVRICNSWNERRVPYRNCQTRFSQLENIVDAITSHRKVPNVYYLRYEDLFDNDHHYLRQVMDDIGLDYDDSVFDTRDSGSLSHRGISSVSRKKPSPLEHEKLRTWQINQPFVNFDRDKRESYLTHRQRTWLTNNRILERLYPEIPRMILEAKPMNENRKLKCGPTL